MLLPNQLLNLKRSLPPVIRIYKLKIKYYSTYLIYIMEAVRTLSESVKDIPDLNRIKKENW